MNDITHLNRDDLPTTRSLFKATAVAALVAAVVLITAVLPAEYGIDPTGIGERMGLKSLSAGSPAPTEAPSQEVQAQAGAAPQDSALSAPAALSAVWKSPSPYRSDQLSLTLRPDEGAEIKAVMRRGERLVFTWAVDGGVVNFDMHGEKTDAKKDEFTSYWKGRAAATGHGAFEAPFDGTHGWYWRNRGKQPVTVKVQTSGFYEKLYRP